MKGLVSTIYVRPQEDDLSVSELLRQGIRLFMEEREWRRRERLERLRSRQNDQE